MQNADQRNIIIAIALSLVILLGFNYLMAPTEEQIAAQKAEQAKQQAQQAAQDPATPGSGTTQVPGTQTPGTGEQSLTIALSRSEILEQAQRVAIDTPTLRGSISLVGGRIDDLTLKNYRETIDEGSANITLLSPAGSAHPYFADFGWINGDPSRSIPVPNSKTVWQASGNRLTPTNAVTLTWDNGQGLRFEREIAIDKNYMFQISQRVVNTTSEGVSLAPYSLVSRTGTPEVLGFYILHEGPIGVLDDSLTEIDYDDLKDDKKREIASTGGWLGITDKYWLTAIIPDQAEPVNTRFLYANPKTMDRYQTDFFYEPKNIAPGSTVQYDSHFFAGAKEVPVIDAYESDLGIQDFDLAVDFGWFYYITKPFFYALHWLTGLLGNVGLSILALTVLIKLILFPLANKSYVSMAKMRKLQPKLVDLRERFGDDKQKLNQEMMALYKQEKVNPAAGCLPIVIQIPIFFSLYKVLFVTLEMRQAPFYGWVQDLSVPDPTSIINGFGLLPWGIPEVGTTLAVLNIGIWPILMGISMFLQQRLNPQPTDPVQAKVFLFMPLFFTFLLGNFPAGLVIYWTWNNTLSIIQQAVIMKKAGVPIGRSAEPSKG